MKLFRSILAASVLAGFGLGCSDNKATKPPNAPAIEDEKGLPPPKPPGPGPKQRPK